MVNLLDITDAAESANAPKPIGPDGDVNFYDNAIVGITDVGVLVYGKEKMAFLLEEVSDEMDYNSAWEFLEYNTFSSYIGEMTPLYINQYI